MKEKLTLPLEVGKYYQTQGGQRVKCIWEDGAFSVVRSYTEAWVVHKVDGKVLGGVFQTRDALDSIVADDASRNSFWVNVYPREDGQFSWQTFNTCQEADDYCLEIGRLGRMKVVLETRFDWEAPETLPVRPHLVKSH
jgi:hypothetical protein